MNSFFEHWLEMLQDDMKEKAQTILEIMSRLDMNDEKTAERVSSPEYQSLVRKAFRDWSGAESEDKRIFIRNILANAADKTLTSDDVVRMFLKWIDTYSELHFAVIASIYNDFVTRARIWEKVGKEEVREDSAEADMFKLLIRDLSTGSIIRQHREKDGAGHFLRKQPATQRRRSSTIPRTMESAFEDTKGYELTELGQQFVHYAMTDLPVKIGFDGHATESNASAEFSADSD